MTYTWPSTVGSSCDSYPFACVFRLFNAATTPIGLVHRPLLSRQEHADGVNLSRQTTYTPTYEVNSPYGETMVTEIDEDGSGHTLRNATITIREIV